MLTASITGSRRWIVWSEAENLRWAPSRKRSRRSGRRISLSGRNLMVVKAPMVEEDLEKLGLALRSIGSNRVRHVQTDAFAAGKIAGQQFDYALGISSAA